jgi:beta-lactamase class D
MKDFRGYAALLIGLLMLAGCRTRVVERPDFARHFEAAGYSGSLLLYDSQKKRYLAYNSARVDSQFLPASTFKIFNSLVALETGVAPDEKMVIPWDSVERSIAAWNQDHDMASAIKVSCVPYYQEIARRIGRERMQHWLDREGYGNASIGPEIHMFWLDGSLQISQREQIDFLRRLQKRKLGFSKRSQDIVCSIIDESLPPHILPYTIFSKTGWGIVNGKHFGWYVGWVEAGKDTRFFALNLQSDNPGDDFALARRQIVMNILKELDWLQPNYSHQL